MSATWFITGASSGFGRLLTERLLARGDRVVGTTRRAQALDELKPTVGDRLVTPELDVTDTAEIRRVVDGAWAQMGRIDVVVSNAGYGLFGAAEELSDEDIRRQLETNLLGSIQLIRAALPHLRAQGGGRVLQVSSEGGQIAYPNFSLYHATKWGIEGFVEAVAQETKSFGIQFTLVEPGPTKTGFGASLTLAEPLAAYRDTPAGRMRQAREDGTAGWVFDEPGWMVDAMIASAEQQPAPRRLTLGAGSYTRIRDALAERLAALKAQGPISGAVQET